MELTVPTDEGDPIHFECADTWVSRWVCEAILQGKTYPRIELIDDVQVIFDVGANCGAATVHLARSHHGATVHAFEPASEPRAYLERNVADLPDVHVHPFGLRDVDQVVPLFRGDGDSITGSVHRREVNLDETEDVELRAAGPWARQQEIDRVDVMKVDVEGCEVEVLESLRGLLPTVKVLYVEYDSRGARRQIDDLLRPTHHLYFAMLQVLDQGECIYVRNDLADLPGANAELRRLFRSGSD